MPTTINTYALQELVIATLELAQIKLSKGESIVCPGYDKPGCDAEGLDLEVVAGMGMSALKLSEKTEVSA